MCFLLGECICEEDESITESSSMPPTSVSDMEDGVSNLGICINLSSLSQVSGLCNGPAITTYCSQAYLPSTLSSIISNTCISSVSTTGMSISAAALWFWLLTTTTHYYCITRTYSKMHIQ